MGYSPRSRKQSDMTEQLNFRLQSLGASPGALPSRGSGFPVGISFP